MKLTRDSDGAVACNFDTGDAAQVAWQQVDVRACVDVPHNQVGVPGSRYDDCLVGDGYGNTSHVIRVTHQNLPQDFKCMYSYVYK